MARTAPVFGGTGFIGRYVVKGLAEAGWVVRVAVRHPAAALFLKPMGDVGQITPVAANLRDDASVAAAVAGVDSVFNLVGILYQRRRQRFAAVHGEGAGRAAAAAAAAGVARLAHVSAIGADPRSRAACACSKAAGESAVLARIPAATD